MKGLWGQERKIDGASVSGSQRNFLRYPESYCNEEVKCDLKKEETPCVYALG